MASAETEMPSAIPGRTDNLEYSLRNLLAFDITPVDPAQLDERTRDAAQLLINHIFTLPSQKSEEGPVALLPAHATYVLPRSKPIPKPKPLTRWQKYAQEHGIEKRKRSRLVWDEITKDWVPRWGAKSIKKIQDKSSGILEVQDGEDPYEDLFEARSKQKSLVKAKQKLRELRNTVESTGKKLPAGVPSLARGMKHSDSGQENLNISMNRAKYSTASFGRHDPLAEGEVPTRMPVKRKVAPKPLKEEREGYKRILTDIFKPPKPEE
eukprot:GHVT01047966.1.p1 GENE.GHVT01047966.1~~GHVT01047966.1.p1  ORF type:complete len:266 (+),score=36.44 GHVT01047966.1:190-987(+)